MKARRLHCPLIAVLALCAAGTTSCEYDDDDCEYDDDDFDDDDFDDDFDDDDFDDDDIYGCSYIVIVGQSRGGVVVLLTDRPRSDIASARVNIADLTLESREVDPEPLYRWDSGHTVDLVPLRGTPDTRIHEVVASRGGIRPAVYDSIRLTVREPSIVLSTGETLGPADIHLVGGGNMLVDFAEPLILGPSDVVYIVLDFDLERSFPDGGPAGGPRWTLRPIILADMLREDVGRSVKAPTDLTGVVARVGRKGDTFDMELSEGRGALEVRLAPGAVVRGEGSAPAIREGSRVLARGAWTPEGHLRADAVIVGETFEATGLLRELTPSGGGCMDARILVSAGQALEGDLRLEACPGTLVTLDRIGSAGLGDLREGMVVAVAGRAGKSPAPAALIDVKQGSTVLSIPGDAAGEEGRLAGKVVAVDEASGIIAIASGADLHELEAGGASILLVEEAGGMLRERRISIREVEDGMDLEAGEATGRNGERLLIVTTGEPGIPTTLPGIPTILPGAHPR